MATYDSLLNKTRPVGAHLKWVLFEEYLSRNMKGIIASLLSATKNADTVIIRTIVITARKDVQVPSDQLPHFRSRIKKNLFSVLALLELPSYRQYVQIHANTVK